MPNRFDGGLGPEADTCTPEYWEEAVRWVICAIDRWPSSWSETAAAEYYG
jgi:hypothetical protein